MTDRPVSLRFLTMIVFALVIFCLGSSDAQAQHNGPFAERNRRFYGPDYVERSYADQAGAIGYRRHENGGFYGPPQLYSRQYGTVFGYQTARPFVRPQTFGRVGPEGTY